MNEGFFCIVLVISRRVVGEEFVVERKRVYGEFHVDGNVAGGGTGSGRRLRRGRAW